jgi:hypothetical protein
MWLQTAVSVLGAAGGLGVLGLVVRSIYRSLSKTHRRAVDADTDRDLVDIAMSMLAPAEEQIERLSKRLAEEEGRAERLTLRIKELETSSKAREEEMGVLQHQVQELNRQLIEAQLEVIRLRGLLSADSGA